MSPLVARDQELAAVLTMLEHPDRRLVSITGRSGVGKTRLAREIAHRFEEQRRGTVAFTVLSPITDPRLVLYEIGATLGAGELPGADPVQWLAARIGGREQLIVLDGLERLMAATDDLERLLGACPDMRFLVTSQSPLKLQSEQRLRLRPLRSPTIDEHDPASIASAPAVALYCERATAADADFHLSDDNALEVAALCRDLEGLPLAIELAAARATTLPAGTLRSRLRTARLDLLRADHPDLSERHRTLRAAIAWSYELCPPDAQRLLRRLAVTTGSFDLDDAATLSEDRTFEALHTLVETHLVDPGADGTEGRYELPTSIAAFAREQLTATGESALAELMWSHWCAARARNAATAMDSLEEFNARDWVASAHESLVATLTRCVERDDASQAMDLLSALEPYWHITGMPDACATTVDRAFALAARDGIATAAHAEALAASTLVTRWAAGDDARARTLERLNLARAIAETVDDDGARLHVLSARGRTMATMGDLGDAAIAIADGLALAQAVASGKWTGRFQVWAGMLAHQQGDVVQAVTLGLAGLRQSRDANDERMIVAAAMLLIPLKQHLSRGGAELPPAPEIIDLAHRTGQAQMLLVALPILSLDALAAGDMATAAQRTAEALRLFAAKPQSPFVVWTLMVAAQIAAAAHQTARAARYHGAARLVLPFLVASMPPETKVQYDRVIEGVAVDLGPEEFERAAQAGEDVDRPEVLEEALEWIETLSPAAPTGRQQLLGRRSQGALSERQLDVLRLMAGGMSNKDIAAMLAITARTVEHHAEAIFRKLNVRNRSEATAWAYRSGMMVA
jgi:predicted ATPase/DNA-binding CsgD family transcriptional regulator